jgi:hypothetical protein
MSPAKRPLWLSVPVVTSVFPFIPSGVFRRFMSASPSLLLVPLLVPLW